MQDFIVTLVLLAGTLQDAPGAATVVGTPQHTGLPLIVHEAPSWGPPGPPQVVTSAPDPWAQRVADCESGSVRADGTAIPDSSSTTAVNPRSSARGKYQFIRSTWESVTGLPAPASAYPEHVQDAAFLTLWDGGRGWRHWLPSMHCWNYDGSFVAP